jgi:hypothetical protein
MATVFEDTAFMRKIYYGFFMVRMLVQMLVLPIYLLKIDNVFLGSKVCSKILETNINVDSILTSASTDQIGRNFEYFNLIMASTTNTTNTTNTKNTESIME